jgi:hypothetical protein
MMSRIPQPSDEEGGDGRNYNSDESYQGSQSDSNGSSGKGTDDDIKSIGDTLTKKETAAVSRLRVLVMLVLLMAAVGICFTIYLLMRNAQLEELSIQYNGAAQVRPLAKKYEQDFLLNRTTLAHTDPFACICITRGPYFGTIEGSRFL